MEEHIRHRIRLLSLLCRAWKRLMQGRVLQDRQAPPPVRHLHIRRQLQRCYSFPGAM